MAPTGTLTVSPSILGLRGSFCTLAWSSQNAASASLNGGIGTVRNPSTGSVRTFVEFPTTFAMTFVGSDGGTSVATASVAAGPDVETSTAGGVVIADVLRNVGAGRLVNLQRLTADGTPSYMIRSISNPVLTTIYVLLDSQTDNSTKILAVDVTVPASPRVVATTTYTLTAPPSFSTKQTMIDDGHIYYVKNGSLFIFDYAANPMSPVLKNPTGLIYNGFGSPIKYAPNVLIDEDKANPDSLYKIDVSDPTNPSQTHTLTSGGGNTRTDVSGIRCTMGAILRDPTSGTDYYYRVTGFNNGFANHGLWFSNVSSTPPGGGTLDYSVLLVALDVSPICVKSSINRMFVLKNPGPGAGGANTWKLTSFDCSAAPSTLTLKGETDTTIAYNVAQKQMYLRGNFAIILGSRASGTVNSIHIYDIGSNVDLPAFSNSFSPAGDNNDGSSTSMVLWQNFLFLGFGTSTGGGNMMAAYDVTNPAVPVSLGPSVNLGDGVPGYKLSTIAGYPNSMNEGRNFDFTQAP